LLAIKIGIIIDLATIGDLRLLASIPAVGIESVHFNANDKVLFLIVNCVGLMFGGNETMNPLLKLHLFRFIS